jgi:hypothetical protein
MYTGICEVVTPAEPCAMMLGEQTWKSGRSKRQQMNRDKCSFTLPPLGMVRVLSLTEDLWSSARTSFLPTM